MAKIFSCLFKFLLLIINFYYFFSCVLSAEEIQHPRYEIQIYDGNKLSGVLLRNNQEIVKFDSEYVNTNWSDLMTHCPIKGFKKINTTKNTNNASLKIIYDKLKINFTYKDNDAKFSVVICNINNIKVCIVETADVPNGDLIFKTNRILNIKSINARKLECDGKPALFNRAHVKISQILCSSEFKIEDNSLVETASLSAKNISIDPTSILHMNGKAPYFSSINWINGFYNRGQVLASDDLQLTCKGNMYSNYAQYGNASLRVEGNLSCQMSNGNFELFSTQILVSGTISLFVPTLSLNRSNEGFKNNKNLHNFIEFPVYNIAENPIKHLAPSIICSMDNNIIISSAVVTNNVSYIISKKGMALTVSQRLDNNAGFQKYVDEKTGSTNGKYEWIPASIISGDTMLVTIKNEQCLLNNHHKKCEFLGLENTGALIASGILQISSDNVTQIINGLKQRKQNFINYDALEKQIKIFSTNVQASIQTPNTFEALLEQKKREFSATQPLIYNFNKNIRYVYSDALQTQNEEKTENIPCSFYASSVQKNKRGEGYEFPNNIYSQPHLRMAYSPSLAQQLLDASIISAFGTRLPGFKDADSQWEALCHSTLHQNELKNEYYKNHKPILINVEADCGFGERCYVPMIFMRGHEDLLRANQGLIEGKKTVFNTPFSNIINFGTIRSLENVTITAKTVKNISPGMSEYCRVGSKVYEIRTQLPGGMIVGFDVDINVGNDPTDKDKTVFSNEGGTVFASHNVNLYAKYGDQEIKPFLGSHIVAWNSGTLGEMFGAKDSSLVVDYKAGRIAAGNDMKMIAKAGHILGEASELIAGNDTNIKGTQGVLFRTLMSTYVENDEVNLFSASHRENVSTGTMKVSSLHNINIESSEGKTEGVGTAYEAANKLFFKGKKGNEQRAATAQLNYWNASWGMTPAGFFYETTKVRDEHIVQSVVSAREVIYETDFDNVFEAVIMCGKDAIHVTAGRDNKFVGHDRKTTVEQNGITLGISYPGSDLLAGLTGPGFVKYAEDHEISKLLQRLKNGNPYDIAADSTKMLIDVLRAALDYKDKVMGADIGHLPWLSSHLGFTDAAGSFNPSLQFRLGVSHKSTESHEKKGSSINTINFVCRNGGKTLFADGTEVNVDYIDIDASDVMFIGAENIETSKTDSGGFTINVGPSGISSVGADYAYEKTYKKEHKKTVLKAKKVKIHCKTLGIVDAFVSTQIIDGKITEKFFIEGNPDQFQKTNLGGNVNIGADSASVGVNTAYVDNNESKQQSGLHADTGNLETPLTEMTGATRINGSFTLNTTKLVGHEIVDTSHNDTLTLGLSALPNAHVVQGMAEVSKETGNKQTVNRPTIDPSVYVQTQKMEGINRDTNKMQEVLSDKHSYFRLAIPIVNPQKAQETLNDLKNLFRGNQVSEKAYEEKLEEFNKAAGIDEFFNSDDEEDSSDNQNSSNGEQATQENYQSTNEQQFETNHQDANKLGEQSHDASHPHGNDADSDAPATGSSGFSDEPEHGSQNTFQDPDSSSTQQNQPESELYEGSILRQTKIKTSTPANKKHAATIDLVEYNEFSEPQTVFSPWQDVTSDNNLNPDGTVSVAFTQGFNKNFKTQGSLSELSLMAEQLEAFADNRPVLLEAPTTMDKIKGKIYKFLNFADNFIPVKDTYTLLTNRNWDDGFRNPNWSDRIYAALRIATTVAVAKTAQVGISKVGVPVLKWLAKTKPGKVVADVLEKGARKGLEKGKCLWNKGSNFVKKAFTSINKSFENASSKVADFALSNYDKIIKKWIENKWAPKAITYAQLTKVNGNLWKSPNGLLWGPCRKFGTRINHVLAHGFSNPFKDSHSMFNIPKEQIIKLVDDAWALRGSPLPNNPKIYDIPINKVIGKNGETSIRIVVKATTSEILTAFPIK